MGDGLDLNHIYIYINTSTPCLRDYTLSIYL